MEHAILPFLRRDAGAARTRVKICGLTNERDTRDAIELGADALGFNLYRGSRRFVDLKDASAWIRELPSSVARVAVMVNPTLPEAEEVARLPYIDVVQFHGHEDESFCAQFARLGLPFIKAVAVKDEASLQGLGNYGTPYVLIDAYSPEAFGGTGRMIDGELLKRHAPAAGNDIQLILSGGLKPDNVGEAIRNVRPFAVDVASGVEVSPGRKGRGLMEAFIKAARESAH